MIDLKERRKALKEKIRHAYDSIEFITAEDKDLLDEIISEVSSLVKAEKQAEIEALKAKLEQSEKVWISVESEKPTDGQNCLVVFEVQHSKDDVQRFMAIDQFNEGEFDSIIEYEDMANTVSLPAGSITSKLLAICWAPTELSNKPQIFDQFYKEIVEEAQGDRDE